MRDEWSALSDPTRRQILVLLKSRPYTAGEIADQFLLSHATVSHHLKTLREGGLVTATRRAQTIIFSLNVSKARDMGLFLLDLTGV